jgi:EmrB/QacA subfamily drug resistance transporter
MEKFPMELTVHYPAQSIKAQRLVAFIVFVAVFMAVVDGSVVNIALPTITTYFGVNVGLSQWVITGYLVTMTSLLLIFGRISEYFGQARVFTTGFLIFTLGSLACGLAPSLPLLVFFRVIQAIGGAMLFSLSSAIIYHLYPREELGKAMGYIGATVAIGSIAGPVLGGFIVDALGWEYIFLINVPIGVVFVPLAMHYFRSMKFAKKAIRMDWIGAFLLVTFMILLILTMSELAENFALTIPVAVTGGVFLATLAGFIVTQRRVRDPLLDLSIFRFHKFSLPVLATFLYFIALFMINLVGPFYFEGVFGLAPSQVGLVFLIMPLVMVVGSPIAGWLYDNHYSPYYPMAGMAIAGISMFMLAWLAIRMELFLIIAAFFPMTIGSALFQSPNNTEIMSALPAEKVGIASSISATVRNLGMALGASFGSILLVVGIGLSGYSGPVLEANNVVLAFAAALIMGIAGVLTLTAGVVSFARARIVAKER